MREDSEIYIQVKSVLNMPLLVKCLRKILPMPVSEIVSAIKTGEPILIRRLYTREHGEAEATLITLFRELEEFGVQFEILHHDEQVSQQYLLNLFERWQQIGYDVQMETELELGEPSEEALRWGRGEFRSVQEED